MYSLLTEKCGVHLSLTPLLEDFVEPVIVLIRAEALLRGAPIVGFQPIRDFSKARPADSDFGGYRLFYRRSCDKVR